MTNLTARRINWSALTTSEIEAVRTDAGAHGDSRLVRLATAALRRR